MSKIAEALFEITLPRFSGDMFPRTDAGIVLAVADRYLCIQNYPIPDVETDNNLYAAFANFVSTHKFCGNFLDLLLHFVCPRMYTSYRGRHPLIICFTDWIA